MIRICLYIRTGLSDDVFGRVCMHVCMSVSLLYLDNSGISGPVPSEVGLLTSLQRMSLRSAASGTFPTVITLLTALVYDGACMVASGLVGFER